MIETKWTPDDVRWLRRFVADRVPVVEIAAAMDRPIAAVESAIQEFCVAAKGVVDRLAPIRQECARMLMEGPGPLSSKQLSDRSADWLEEEIELALAGHPSFDKVRGRWRVIG